MPFNQDRHLGMPLNQVDCTSVEPQTRLRVERLRAGILARLPPMCPPLMIAGTPGNRVRRTFKLLLALARGSWIVQEEWLDSLEVSELPEYEMTSVLPGCRRSRLAGGGSTLHGLTVTMVLGATAQSAMLPPEELEQVLCAAGAIVETRRAIPTKRRRGQQDDLRARQLLEVRRGDELLHLDDANEALLEGIMCGRFRHALARRTVTSLPPTLPATASDAENEPPSEELTRRRPRGRPSQAGCARVPPASSDAESLPPALKRARRSAPEWLLSPPSIGDGGPALRVELLPPAVVRECVTALPPALDEAVEIYRSRLPRCNVSMSQIEPVHGADKDSSLDFLGQIVTAFGSRTATLRESDALASRGGKRPSAIGACTFVLHEHLGFCELQLLAVTRRYSRPGMGSALLGAVENHLIDRGMRCVVCLAAHDAVGFWLKKGYATIHDEHTLPRSWHAAMYDPFDSCVLMTKWIGKKRRGDPK
jgi:hypothetical protein